jgi:hypothetical protein
MTRATPHEAAKFPLAGDADDRVLKTIPAGDWIQTRRESKARPFQV